MFLITISNIGNTVQPLCQLSKFSIGYIGGIEFQKKPQNMMITDQGAQKKCAFGGCLLALLIKPFFLFLRLSARCGHAASRHNRQVSLCLRLLMEATCSWLTGGVVRVVCGCIQSRVSFCRYSGSGSSGAASMRKVGEQTALWGWLCISCFINLCINDAVFPGHLTQTPFLMKQQRLQLYQSPTTHIRCYMEINCVHIIAQQTARQQ